MVSEVVRMVRISISGQKLSTQPKRTPSWREEWISSLSKRTIDVWSLPQQKRTHFWIVLCQNDVELFSCQKDNKFLSKCSLPNRRGQGAPSLSDSFLSKGQKRVVIFCAKKNIEFVYLSHKRKGLILIAKASGWFIWSRKKTSLSEFIKLFLPKMAEGPI